MNYTCVCIQYSILKILFCGITYSLHSASWPLWYFGTITIPLSYGPWGTRIAYLFPMLPNTHPSYVRIGLLQCLTLKDLLILFKICGDGLSNRELLVAYQLIGHGALRWKFYFSFLILNFLPYGRVNLKFWMQNTLTYNLLCFTKYSTKICYICCPNTLHNI